MTVRELHAELQKLMDDEQGQYEIIGALSIGLLDEIGAQEDVGENHECHPYKITKVSENKRTYAILLD